MYSRRIQKPKAVLSKFRRQSHPEPTKEQLKNIFRYKNEVVRCRLLSHSEDSQQFTLQFPICMIEYTCKHIVGTLTY